VHLLRNVDEDLGNLCRNAQFAFVTAGRSEIAAMRAAVRPALTWLRRDADTARYLDEIAMLRTGVTPYRDEQPNCAAYRETVPPPRVRTPFDGTYRMVTPTDCDPAPENCGTWIFYFDRGRFAITQENGDACTWGYGTYQVIGAKVEWLFTDGGGITPTNAQNRPGEDFVFRWSIYKDRVTLSPVPGATSPFNFLLRPWHRLSESPDASLLSNRCPPPPQAIPVNAGGSAPSTSFDGTYRVVNHERCPEDCGTYVFVFDRGRFASTHENGSACGSSYGTYTVSGGTVSWTLSTGELYVWKWNLYKDRLTLTPVSPADLPGYPPLQRVSAQADPSYLSKRCPPPPQALPK
jgi:hypothetical protein